MKSKSLKIYLISAGLLLIIYIVAQANRPKAIDWSVTLNSNDKIPFGTYILFNRLNDIFPGAHIRSYRQTVYNVIADDSVANASYLIIAPAIDLSKEDYEQLVKYVKAGNDVFIGAQYFGKLFRKNLAVATSQNFSFNGKPSTVSFLNPSLNPKKYYSLGKGIGDIYFNRFDTLKAVVLGQNGQHKSNFIKYPMGKGSLYLMANPKFFGNYSLLDPNGSEYAETALSFVKNPGNLLWDQYYTQGTEVTGSPMQVFLSHPVLRWAYYITLFSLILFVLFEIKRRQRIIPVIEPLSNSTLDFVNIVGQVYYEKRNNTNIAQKKVLYLLEHLRDEYQLKTNKMDSEFTEKLAGKLGIELSFAEDIVNYIQYINVLDRVTDRELIRLNNLIEQLYKKSK